MNPALKEHAIVVKFSVVTRSDIGGAELVQRLHEYMVNALADYRLSNNASTTEPLVSTWENPK